MRREIPQRWLWLGLSLLVVLGVLSVVLKPSDSGGGSTSRVADTALATNPNLDPGQPIDRPAPDFTLTDQFGHRVSLRSYRGRVVLLAFNDSECTTVCPLTTTAMVDARRYLGSAASRVVLLGVDANPAATSVGDVRSYSRLHGMLYAWRFLTGSPVQLRQVWRRYGIEVEIQRGQIDHTPALLAIDPQGRQRMVWMTQMNYASVPQLGQLLAREASRLLPGHPPVRSDLSYSTVAGISPATRVSLPRAGGGRVALGGVGAGPHLALFFDSWSTEAFPNLGARLDALNRYVADAARPRSGLAALTAVDEGSVEPSPAALPALLHRLPRQLGYPVAIDPAGRLADGYEVSDQPFLVLTSSSGRIAWYWDVSTQGWPTLATLERQVRAGLSRVRPAPTPSSAAGAEAALSGSPAPLAILHAQASQLLGSQSALSARLKTLRGYPVVINAWASWCDNCQAEYHEFASASVRYGTRVAFLGADTDDTPASAQAFQKSHPVSYPSYQVPTLGSLGPLGVVVGLPTTIFINRSGKVTDVHTGAYETLGGLDSDIQTYALGG
jgi:cytochrome oxidase Cu insertion factor (SCO1/SenC/PrrC family)/thiol-disulfide isomerase/thioredoxin